MRAYSLLLLLLFSRVLPAFAQTRESWLPSEWTVPTPTPPDSADRAVLYTPDSTRIAFTVLTRILRQQGFEVNPYDSLHLLANRILPDSLHLKGGAALHITVVAATSFPCVLVISSNGTPDLQRLHRLSGPSRAHPAGRKVYYPGEPGMDTGRPGTLSQISFDAMAAVATAYPKARVMYSTAHKGR
jgi:hypothetical protein